MKVLQKIHLGMMWFNWKAGLMFREEMKGLYLNQKKEYSQNTGSGKQ